MGSCGQSGDGAGAGAGAWIRWIGALILGGALLAGCAGGDSSPEDELEALIAAGEEAAEARELFTLQGLISERYRDEGRRDRREIVRLIAGHFLRNEAIHLLTRVEEIRLDGPDRAEVFFYLAAAGRPMTDFDALVPLRADLFRIELVAVREDGDWRVLSARWRRAEQSEVLKRLLQ